MRWHCKGHKCNFEDLLSVLSLSLAGLSSNLLILDVVPRAVCPPPPAAWMSLDSLERFTLSRETPARRVLSRQPGTFRVVERPFGPRLHPVERDAVAQDALSTGWKRGPNGLSTTRNVPGCRESTRHAGVSLDRVKRSRLSREIQAAGGGGQTVRGITFKINKLLLRPTKNRCR